MNWDEWESKKLSFGQFTYAIYGETSAQWNGKIKVFEMEIIVSGISTHLVNPREIYKITSVDSFKGIVIAQQIS